MINLAIYAFIITLCLFLLVIVALMVIMSFFLKIPAQFQWQELSDDQLSIDAQRAFKNIEMTITPFHFAPVKTYLTKGYNIGTENRLYYSAESATALVVLFGSNRGIKQTMIEFMTRLEDGNTIQTLGRTSMKSLFAPTLQAVSSLMDPSRAEALYRKHLTRVESKKVSGIAIKYLQSDQIMEEMIKDHARRLESGVKEGRLRFYPQKNVYRPHILGNLKHITKIPKTNSDFSLNRKLVMAVIGFILVFMATFLSLLFRS